MLADDGKKVSLSDYRGKKVVLYFYPKDGTLGCTEEAIEFRDIAEEFENENGIHTWGKQGPRAITLAVQAKT